MALSPAQVAIPFNLIVRWSREPGTGTLFTMDTFVLRLIIPLSLCFETGSNKQFRSPAAACHLTETFAEHSMWNQLFCVCGIIDHLKMSVLLGFSCPFAMDLTELCFFQILYDPIASFLSGLITPSLSHQT